MNSSEWTPRGRDDIETHLAQLQAKYDFEKVQNTVEVPITDQPIFIRLGGNVLSTLAVVNPTLHLADNEVRSSIHRGGRGAAINSQLSSLLISPADYDFDAGVGFKGLRAGESLTLGRSPVNTPSRFRPFLNGVSREHARITKMPHGKSIHIQDLGSTNGTFVGNLNTLLDEITIYDFRSAEYELSRNVYASSIASERHPEENQDDFLEDPINNIYAVFDGLGGHEDGAMASHTAKESIARSTRVDIPAYKDFESQAAYDFAMEKYLYTALIEANDTIGERSTKAATTAVVVKLHQLDESTVASIAHVGDSRAYLVRNKKLTPLTIDHTPYRGKDDTESMTLQMRLANTESISILTPAEQTIFKRRNYVGATLGNGTEVQHDITHIDVRPGDRLILTTDGIHDNLKDSEIESIVNDATVQDHATQLTAASLARSRDGSHYRRKADDMTAVVIHI